MNQRSRTLALVAALALAATPALGAATIHPDTGGDPMGTAAATKEIFPTGVVSGAKVQELLEQHNQGVIDDHVLGAKLDADGGVTDVDYEAQLTALEIAFEGYTATESAVSRFDHAPGFITEELLTELVKQHNARVTDIAAIATKLNADGTVNDADYASTAKKLFAFGESPAAADVDKGVFIQSAGTGGYNAVVIQALRDQGATLTQDWHDLAAKLDLDSGVTDADYEAQIAAETVSEV